MYCTQCRIQYCLHCGAKTGTLVKWHGGQRCEEYLAEVARSKEEGERRARAASADAECASRRLTASRSFGLLTSGRTTLLRSTARA